MDNTHKKFKRKVSLRFTNMVMITTACVIILFTLFSGVEIMKRYNNMVSDMNGYIACEESASFLADGSDYLTEEVRLYVMTGERKYMDNYFTEAYTTRRRDIALDRMRKCEIEAEALTALTEALSLSNELMIQEFYSMRLVSQAYGYELESLPADVQNVELSEEDAALSREGMLEKAKDLVCGTVYEEYKTSIMGGVERFSKSVLLYLEQRLANSIAMLKYSVVPTIVLTTILFVECVVMYYLTIKFVINPLHYYSEHIGHDKRLDFEGPLEFQELAQIYNDVSELNSVNERMLKHKAEHDPLTGLINRSGFEELRKGMESQKNPLALLIIDVDKFKLVNDRYGHQTGDMVLQRVARLLEKSFRSTDFPARIGGDEFAVIMTDLNYNPQKLTEEKIRQVNDTLLHPTDGLPPVSLSVGGVYSEEGFTDALYKMADAALYRVKENGRCGCSFFDKEKDQI